MILNSRLGVRFVTSGFTEPSVYNHFMYIFKISAEELPDGTFRPTLDLETQQGGGKTHQGFTIPETCETEDQAKERAHQHALDEAKKQGLAEEDFEITVS
jgi:hypothetical protein